MTQEHQTSRTWVAVPRGRSRSKEIPIASGFPVPGDIVRIHSCYYSPSPIPWARRITIYLGQTPDSQHVFLDQGGQMVTVSMLRYTDAVIMI